MIDRNHALPLARQAKVLNLSRNSLYYKPRPVSAEDLVLMRRLDERISTTRSPARACCVRCCGARAFVPAGGISQR